MNCLLVVDMQRDFMPGGPLGIPGADQRIPLINSWMQRCDFVVGVRDWHPLGHVSFASAHAMKPGDILPLDRGLQILWPEHCVQDSPGARWAEGLDAGQMGAQFFKGIDPDVDSYSAFYDNARRRATGLVEFLEKKKADHLYFAGVATDYCILYSVLDALEAGFRVTVIRSACAPINLHPQDEEKALETMVARGAQVVDAS